MITANPLEWDAPYLVIVAALFVIVMLRANGTYWVGRLLHRGAQRSRMARLIQTPGYGRATAQLNRWGPPVVSLSFLTIGFQTLVNLAAGATRMPLRTYLPAVTVGSVLWAFLYGTVGLAGFESLALIWQRSPAAAIALGLLAAGALAAFVVWRVRQSRRGGSESGPEDPSGAVPDPPGSDRPASDDGP